MSYQRTEAVLEKIRHQERHPLTTSLDNLHLFGSTPGDRKCGYQKFNFSYEQQVRMRTTDGMQPMEHYMDLIPGLQSVMRLMVPNNGAPRRNVSYEIDLIVKEPEKYGTPHDSVMILVGTISNDPTARPNSMSPFLWGPTLPSTPAPDFYVPNHFYCPYYRTRTVSIPIPESMTVFMVQTESLAEFYMDTNWSQGYCDYSQFTAMMNPHSSYSPCSPELSALFNQIRGTLNASFNNLILNDAHEMDYKTKLSVYAMQSPAIQQELQLEYGVGQYQLDSVPTESKQHRFHLSETKLSRAAVDVTEEFLATGRIFRTDVYANDTYLTAAALCKELKIQPVKEVMVRLATYNVFLDSWYNPGELLKQCLKCIKLGCPATLIPHCRHNFITRLEGPLMLLWIIVFMTVGMDLDDVKQNTVLEGLDVQAYTLYLEMMGNMERLIHGETI